jgi:hypothetical protein
LKRIWKEAAVAYSSYYPNSFLERLRKTTKNFRIAGVRAGIRTEHVPGTGQKLLRMSQFQEYDIV